MKYILALVRNLLISLKPISFIGAGLLLFLSGCDLKTNLVSLLSISNVPVCEIADGEITNPPCELPDGYEEYFISEEKYSGRNTEIVSQTIATSSTLIYGDSGFEGVAVVSQLPMAWSTGFAIMSLDKSLSQQGGNYNPDYIAANIVSGTSIFGLVGTFASSQKVYCSSTDTASATSTVDGISLPANGDKCVAPENNFIYATAFNGRDKNCNMGGGANSQSCFVPNFGQDFYLANANSVPLACTYGNNNGTFWDISTASPTYGKLKSPTVSGIVRDFCQVAQNQFFYPDVYGGRVTVCGPVPNPPCWLDIPPYQTRSVNLGNTSTTPLCLEDQNDNLPTNWKGGLDEPVSKNSAQCLTAGNSRYVYNTAYDGRFRVCNGTNLGQCYYTGAEVSTSINYIFTTSENSSCRTTLNSCVNTCATAKTTCNGQAGADPNKCFGQYSSCYYSCYERQTVSGATPVGYGKCADNACTTTRNACNTACGSNTTCKNNCTTAYNDCKYVESPRDGIWYLNASYSLTNPTTKTLIIPAGQKKSASTALSQLLNTSAIKAGVNIFGITGSFGGIGVWASGMHRDKSVPQLTLNEENNNFSGSSEEALPTSVPNFYEPLKPYREITSIMKDDDGSTAEQNVLATPERSSWGQTQCGVDASLDTLDKKISDCGAKFGSLSSWDGVVSGNAGQGRWTLVTRKLNASTNTMVEVWRDERTMMLWSSLISEGTNWCKASGSSNSANVSVNNRYKENDASGICNNSANQAQDVAASVISACLEDLGFTNIDSDFTINGKADLNLSSSPKIHWRVPTLYDYEVAEYNGIRFVLPDMGTQRSIPLVEWTGTVNSANRSEAWGVNSMDGAHRLINRSDLAGVRCIGR